MNIYALRDKIPQPTALNTRNFENQTAASGQRCGQIGAKYISYDNFERILHNA